MDAFLLMAAAALGSAQPMPAVSGDAVGPLQNPTSSTDQFPDPIADESQIKPARVELPSVSDGAELRVKGSALKLKVPI